MVCARIAYSVEKWVKIGNFSVCPDKALEEARAIINQQCIHTQIADNVSASFARSSYLSSNSYLVLVSFIKHSNILRVVLK